jgi:hypothetical protein
MLVGANYNESDYAKTGALSYFLADSGTFVVGGNRYQVAQVGVGCGLGPVYVLGGALVYIGLLPCATYAIGACVHAVGPVLVPDYLGNTLLPDGGTLFLVDPAWLAHFLITIGFIPIINGKVGGVEDKDC